MKYIMTVRMQISAVVQQGGTDGVPITVIGTLSGTTQQHKVIRITLMIGLFAVLLL